ncbi:hypothetical protein [Streptomyces sp. NPDC046182]
MHASPASPTRPRPSWKMEWPPAAKAGLWHTPVNWTARSDFAL